MWLLLAISFWWTRGVDIWQPGTKKTKNLKTHFLAVIFYCRARSGQIIISLYIATFSHSLSPPKLTAASFICPNKKIKLNLPKLNLAIFVERLVGRRSKNERSKEHILVEKFFLNSYSYDQNNFPLHFCSHSVANRNREKWQLSFCSCHTYTCEDIFSIVVF